MTPLLGTGLVKLSKDGSEKERRIMDAINSRFDNSRSRDYVHG